MKVDGQTYARQTRQSSGWRSAGNLEMYGRWTVRSRPLQWNVTTARNGYVTEGFYADQTGSELNNLRSRGCQDINGTSIRMRVLALHMDNAFVFCGFEFGQVRVHCRRFTRVRVYVE
jgi:hypothetical protein